MRLCLCFSRVFSPRVSLKKVLRLPHRLDVLVHTAADVEEQPETLRTY
jgi:hypothetical protein